MNAPAQNAQPIVAFKSQLDQRMEQFKNALPAHMPPERFARVVLTAVQNNPDLLNADRQALWNACMRAAQDGLLPDGREGAIVIYNTKEKGQYVKKAQWMPMVFGIVKKVRNSGQLAMITARVVYDGDQYRYWLDEDGEHILYEPCEQPNKNVVRVVFACAKTKDGELLVEPLTPSDIEKIRNSSRAKDNGPWVDWWEEMAKKSAIRRLAKRLPMSSDLDDLVRRDDDLYDFEGAKTPARVVSLDPFSGGEPAAERPAPPVTAPKPQEQAPPAAGAPQAPTDQKADGGEGDVRDAPPADIDTKAPPRAAADTSQLEQSISDALAKCQSGSDIQGVASLFGGEIADVDADAQERIDKMFDDARAALFPADRDR